MKISIIVFFVAISVFGCKPKPLTNQEKGEALVKSYLDSVLNDPSSYQSINFDTIKADSGFVSNLKFQSLLFALDSIRTLSEELDYKPSYSPKAEEIKKSNLIAYDSQINKIRFQLDSIEKNHPNQPEVWHINHNFRTKNESGVLIRYSYHFRLDKNINRVLDALDWKDYKDNY